MAYKGEQVVKSTGSNTNRWLSPDTIVPNPANPQSFNRYSYVRNNPVNFSDPSGRSECGVGQYHCAGDSPVTFASSPTTVAYTGPEEFSDWNEGTYSGCFMCHAAKETPYTSLTNSELLLVQNQMSEAAFQGTVAAGTGIIVGTGAYYLLCVNDGDCSNELQGVWNLHPFKRGVAIENALGRSPELAQNFPVIDRFNNGVATSIKSIDLGAKSYQNINTLTRTITNYVDKLANWQGASWGGVTIRSSDIASRELLLAISPGASQSQIDALLQLQQWAASQGVTLTTVTIP